MNKDYKSQPVIVPEHEEIHAEEYVKDSDQVYRKKEDVVRGKFKGSIFWGRVACFIGLSFLSFVFIFKSIKLIVNSVQVLLNRFNHLDINRQFLKTLNECLALSKVILGLAVGVINPNWGKRLLSLFFSMNPKKWDWSSIYSCKFMRA